MMMSGAVLFPFDPKLVASSDLSAVPVQRIAAKGPRIEKEYSLEKHGIVAIAIKNVDAGVVRNYRLGSGG